MVALLTVAALFVAPVCQAVYRMLSMRFMQQVWKKCYTDKRSFMFGTLYKAETWIKIAASCGRLQAAAVILGFGHYAWMLHAAHPFVAILSGLVALSGITTWTWSNTFARDAQVLKTALRNRMRQGQSMTTGKTGRASYSLPGVSTKTGDVNVSAFDQMFARYAPGRDHLTAYDFSRMHEGNRVRAAQEGKGNFISRAIKEFFAKRLTKRIMFAFADRVVEEDHNLVTAVSKETMLRVLQGSAERDLASERGQNRDCSVPSGLGWKESYEGGSAAAEEAMIRQWMVDVQQVQQANEKAAGSQTPYRAFHARSRCSVDNAEFRVSKDIPEFLQVGDFKPGSSFKAKVRLSNASGVPKADTEKDLRGLGIEVELPNDAVQDFLMTNAPANHARNARQFVQFAQAGAAGKAKMPFKLIGSVGLFEAVRILRTVIRQSSRPVESLATESYWGRAPFAFNQYALKYACFPAESQPVSVPKGPEYLKQDMIERLKLGPVVFDFKVQLFNNDKLTPIEDGSVEWKECDSPFITIAQLVIPQQDLTTAEALAAEKAIEAMGFNPWKTIAGILPLGGLNRARRLVYKASQMFRSSTRSDATSSVK
jgi:hypothetical protein